MITQAQIDAVAKMLEDYWCNPKGETISFEALAKNLLTAAPEVGPKPLQEPELPAGDTPYNQVISDTIDRCVQQLEKIGCRYCNGHDLPLQLRALKDIAAPTAAAEVGDNNWNEARIAIENYTIDRCADKVLELFSTPAGIFPTGRDIAAAIRKMKDNP